MKPGRPEGQRADGPDLLLLKPPRLTLISGQGAEPANCETTTVASAGCFGVRVSVDLVSAGLIGGGKEPATGLPTVVPCSQATIRVSAVVPDDPLAVLVAGAIKEALPKAAAGFARPRLDNVGAAVSSLSDRLIGEMFAAGLSLAHLREHLVDPDGNQMLEAALMNLESAISILREAEWQAQRGPFALRRSNVRGQDLTMTQTLHEQDVTLKDAVTQELRWTPSIDSAQIGVSVVDGTVTLSGEVNTYPEKLLASKAAQRVLGVVAIAQEITISDTWRGINDSDIAEEAGDALTRNVVVPASVKAAVQKHIITLSGEVEWQFQREAASHSVQHLKGVAGVHNLVAIRPKVRAGDLKSAISAALVRHAQLDSRTISVTTTTSGAVTLRGTVRTWAERQQAENACWAAPGITAVDNGLRVVF